MKRATQPISIFKRMATVLGLSAAIAGCYTNSSSSGANKSQQNTSTPTSTPTIVDGQTQLIADDYALVFSSATSTQGNLLSVEIDNPNPDRVETLEQAQPGVSYATHGVIGNVIATERFDGSNWDVVAFDLETRAKKFDTNSVETEQIKAIMGNNIWFSVIGNPTLEKIVDVTTTQPQAADLIPDDPTIPGTPEVTVQQGNALTRYLFVVEGDIHKVVSLDTTTIATSTVKTVDTTVQTGFSKFLFATPNVISYKGFTTNTTQPVRQLFAFENVATGQTTKVEVQAQPTTSLSLNRLYDILSLNENFAVVVEKNINWPHNPTRLLEIELTGSQNEVATEIDFGQYAGQLTIPTSKYKVFDTGDNLVLLTGQTGETPLVWNRTISHMQDQISPFLQGISPIYVIPYGRDNGKTLLTFIDFSQKSVGLYFDGQDITDVFGGVQDRLVRNDVSHAERYVLLSGEKVLSYTTNGQGQQVPDDVKTTAWHFDTRIGRLEVVNYSIQATVRGHKLHPDGQKVLMTRHNASPTSQNQATTHLFEWQRSAQPPHTLLYRTGPGGPFDFSIQQYTGTKILATETHIDSGILQRRDIVLDPTKQDQQPTIISKRP